MIRKLMALAGLVVALEACAGPPPPTYSADAFKGIFNQNSASVPANAPATMTPPDGISSARTSRPISATSRTPANIGTALCRRR